MASNPRLRVAIVGGGIGGQMLAIALAPFHDIQIDIYEGASKFETIGAGLALWGEGVTVCKKLGIMERLLAIALVEDPTYLRLKRANQAGGRHFGDTVLSRALGFHRAQFLDLLVQILKETGRGNIHFGKRCVSFSQTYSDGGNNEDGEAEGQVTINFKDGSSATCDCLIGCDGIRSTIRKQLLDELGWKRTQDFDVDVDESGLRFSGTVAYRALISSKDLQGDHPALKNRITYCGSHKHMVTYPVSDGRLINFIGYSSNPVRYEEWKNGPWTLDEDGSEVAKEFADFADEVQVVLSTVEKTSRWALYEVNPLPHWCKGGVAVLGDAAHAMPPFIGSGGGQVVEDCYILAQLLGDPEICRNDIPNILRSYEFVRKERAENVLNCTREARNAFQSINEYAAAGDDHIVRSTNGLVNWLWEGKLDLDEEVARGKREFERLRSESSIM